MFRFKVSRTITDLKQERSESHGNPTFFQNTPVIRRRSISVYTHEQFSHVWGSDGLQLSLRWSFHCCLQYFATFCRCYVNALVGIKLVIFVLNITMCSNTRAADYNIFFFVCGKLYCNDKGSGNKTWDVK